MPGVYGLRGEHNYYSHGFVFLLLFKFCFLLDKLWESETTRGFQLKLIETPTIVHTKFRLLYFTLYLLLCSVFPVYRARDSEYRPIIGRFVCECSAPPWPVDDRRRDLHELERRSQCKPINGYGYATSTSYAITSHSSTCSYQPYSGYCRSPSRRRSHSDMRNPAEDRRCASGTQQRSR